jgi:hypothetical protein
MAVLDLGHAGSGTYTDCGSLPSPHLVQEAINRAITFCWVLLPQDRRSAKEIAAQIRRVVDRTLANLEEDEAAFRVSKSGTEDVPPEAGAR